jgi:4-methyl-5(b-hydroxyethyl)-thiazole monophosphate biosynthesis
MRKVIIPLAEGLEEIEAVTNIDVLRRAGVEVTTVCLAEDLKVVGDHGIEITADKNINAVQADDLDGIILPGGMPGAANLRDDERVIELVKNLNKANKLVAAICAAPIVLEKAGVIKDKLVTSYPGFEKEVTSCNYQQDRVVIDENIITARGPGVALEFAIKLVEYLVGSDKAQELKAAMLTNF